MNYTTTETVQFTERNPKEKTPKEIGIEGLL